MFKNFQSIKPPVEKSETNESKNSPTLESTYSVAHSHP